MSGPFYAAVSPPQAIDQAAIGNLLARVRALEAVLSTGGDGLKYHEGTYTPGDNSGDFIGIYTDYFAPSGWGPGPGDFQGWGFVIECDPGFPRVQHGNDAHVTNGSVNVFLPSSFMVGNDPPDGSTITIGGVPYTVDHTSGGTGSPTLTLTIPYTGSTSTTTSWSVETTSVEPGGFAVFTRNGAPINLISSQDGASTNAEPSVYISGDGLVEIDSGGDMVLASGGNFDAWGEDVEIEAFNDMILDIGNNLIVDTLPTIDPGVPNAWWNDSGFVAVSP